ncbi:hypothetical protein SDRG_06264 [Saprolegnia diclina VS20]|uniref:SMP-30/Gluconolactonase/LRE-like region domain-containing protein n=1 Tax=Saprolegnia diclina (strain VS20) TaxID=1156394 RepID=T0RUL0_SAPDV|nr:hypothetical protein SDRG_06264 [Saprolegnia diclina VS20]EQC36148.1 hypothetical protein SDRG_06264 [Saprolegnia diclina VS20]|eukprot:XP_008610254.1 hypothetical protein SDRG_06264 [Saprolegnia diclina VS20]
MQHRPCQRHSHASGGRRRSETVRDATRVLCGSGQRGCGDGKATVATFNTPIALGCLIDGTLVVSDCQSNTLRFAAHDDKGGFRVHALRNSSFLAPRGLGLDATLLYVCDTGHHMIKVGLLPDAFLEDMDFGVFAGSGRKGLVDGLAASSAFHHPSSLVVLADHSVLVADTGNHCIRSIHRTHGQWCVRTIAGGARALGPNPVVGRRSSASSNTPLPGYADGVGPTALFRGPSGLALGPLGEVFVADTFNHCVRVLTWSEDAGAWIVETLAGQPKSGHINGACDSALFNQPVGLCVAPDESIFVADKGNNCLRQLGGVVRSHDRCYYSWVRTVTIESFAPSQVFSKGVEPPFLLPKGVCTLQGRYAKPDQVLLGVCDSGNHLVRLVSVPSIARPDVASSVDADGREEDLDDDNNNNNSMDEEDTEEPTAETVPKHELDALQREIEQLRADNATYRQLLEVAVAKMHELSSLLEARSDSTN